MGFNVPHSDRSTADANALDATRIASGLDAARMHRLDPTMEGLAEAAVRYALERIRMDPPPLDGTQSVAALNEFGPTVTAQGMGGLAALQLFCENLAPASISQDHPRALSFVPTAPTEASVLFDLVLAASSIYAGSWMEGSGAVWAENQALRWVADLAGLPPEAGGVFVSGGTQGNLSALVAARESAMTKWGTRSGRWLIAATTDVHSSVRSAARVMNAEILSVRTDSRGRMTGESLRAAVDEARAQGIAVGDADRNAGFAADQPPIPQGVVFAVAATGGTTNVGIVDDLAGIAKVTTAEQVWMHVDGAYGGAALAAPSVRSLFTGIEHADSFIVDPHKWLFAPFDSCALLYRNPALAKAAHTQSASYLDVLQDDNDWNPSDYAVHLTRRARGLPFWFSLATHGSDAYRDAVESSLELTRLTARLIDAHPRLELVLQPELSVVVFSRPGWSEDELNQWSDQLLADGTGFVVPSKWHGQPVLRFCFISPRTTVADVKMILATL
jgi:L-2,4-diaminobutyrate decarboxylase